MASTCGALGVGLVAAADLLHAQPMLLHGLDERRQLGRDLGRIDVTRVLLDRRVHAAAGHFDRDLGDFVGAADPVQVPRIGVHDQPARRWAGAGAAAGVGGGRLRARERRVAQHLAASVAMTLDWKNSRRSMMLLEAYGSANATTVALPVDRALAECGTHASPPPATATTYCLPLAP